MRLSVRLHVCLHIGLCIRRDGSVLPRTYGLLVFDRDGARRLSGGLLPTPAIAPPTGDHDGAVLQRPDHLAATPRDGRQTCRSGPTLAQPGRRRARHRPATTGPRATRCPRRSLAAAGSRRSLRRGQPDHGTEQWPSRPRGAPARPTPPRATPAPIAPGAAAPCGPWRPVCQSGLSKARRASPCTWGTNAQASRVRRVGERPRCRARWPNANAGSVRQAPHGTSSTTASTMPSDHSKPAPAWLVSAPWAHATQPETVQRWCSNHSDIGVHRRPAIDRRGQAVGHRNDRHLLRFPAAHAATGPDVKTQEARLTSEVLYQLSYVGLDAESNVGLRTRFPRWRRPADRRRRPHDGDATPPRARPSARGRATGRRS